MVEVRAFALLVGRLKVAVQKTCFGAVLLVFCAVLYIFLLSRAFVQKILSDWIFT